MCKDLLPILGRIPLLPDDILQPPRHEIHQVLQVNAHEVSIPLVSTKIVIASSTEIAAPWNFSCVCGLPLCWCWWFFIMLRQKLFVWRAFLREKKKTLATSQGVFFLFFARKLAKQKVFALGWWKIVSISIKASHIHRKNLRMLQLLWRMQLQIQCTPMDLRPNVYVTKEPAKLPA